MVGDVDNLATGFDERLQEVEAYLELLQNLETQTRAGPPRVGSGAVTPQQQRILYSVVYLQLYNLVEATITRCVDGFSNAAADGVRRPGALSIELRREWVRHVARTHVELSHEKRLKGALDLCEYLIEASPIQPFTIAKGGGGNWDDSQIAAISKRLGLQLQVGPAATTGVKRPFRNEQGALVYIKKLRNDLAHGTVSFAECGEGITVQELRELTDRTALYLRDVVNFFSASIAACDFWLPEDRPAGVSA
jgi:hypothetical protein